MSQSSITRFFSTTTQRVESIENIEGFNNKILVDGWKETNSPLADLMVPCATTGIQIGMLIPVFTGGELVGWDADDVGVISVYQVIDMGRRVLLETLQPLPSFDPRYCIPTAFDGKLLVLNELGIRTVVEPEKLKEVFPLAPFAAQTTVAISNSGNRDIATNNSIVPPQLPSNAASSKQLELEQKIKAFRVLCFHNAALAEATLGTTTDLSSRDVSIQVQLRLPEDLKDVRALSAVNIEKFLRAQWGIAEGSPHKETGKVETLHLSDMVKPNEYLQTNAMVKILFDRIWYLYDILTGEQAGGFYTTTFVVISSRITAPGELSCREWLPSFTIQVMSKVLANFGVCIKSPEAATWNRDEFRAALLKATAFDWTEMNNREIRTRLSSKARNDGTGTTVTVKATGKQTRAANHDSDMSKKPRQDAGRSSTPHSASMATPNAQGICVFWLMEKLIPGSSPCSSQSGTRSCRWLHPTSISNPLDKYSRDAFLQAVKTNVKSRVKTTLMTEAINKLP